MKEQTQKAYENILNYKPLSVVGILDYTSCVDTKRIHKPIMSQIPLFVTQPEIFRMLLLL